jgi:hypothetical protein
MRPSFSYEISAANPDPYKSVTYTESGSESGTGTVSVLHLYRYLSQDDQKQEKNLVKIHIGQVRNFL